jgi:replication-associated recombination protein RarA
MHGKSPQYAWKRVLVTAAEDIGLGDPQAVAQVYSLAAGWKVAKEGAWYLSPHALTMAVVLLCRAKKDTTIEDLQSLTLESIKRNVKREMPDYALDQHTKVGKKRGATDAEWYRTRHVVFGIPINEYTRRLWKLVPKWRPEECAETEAESDGK